MGSTVLALKPPITFSKYNRISLVQVSQFWALLMWQTLDHWHLLPTRSSTNTHEFSLNYHVPRQFLTTKCIRYQWKTSCKYRIVDSELPESTLLQFLIIIKMYVFSLLSVICPFVLLLQIITNKHEICYIGSKV